MLALFLEAFVQALCAQHMLSVFLIRDFRPKGLKGTDLEGLHPAQWLLPHGAPGMWPVQTEMGCKRKMHPTFQRVSTPPANSLIKSIYIDQMLKPRYFGNIIYVIKENRLLKRISPVPFYLFFTWLLENNITYVASNNWT